MPPTFQPAGADMDPRVLQVDLPGSPPVRYPVRIGRGLLGGAGAPAGTDLDPAGWILVSDENVEPLYGDRVAEALSRGGQSLERVVLPAGEAAKSRTSVAAVQDRALEAGIGRDGCVVALGGGVVGDLAGFAAATLLRGLPYVQIPTTLLAMVDSAVGGKTGINTPRGKNLVGAFHQPAAVIADVGTLDTLPDRELRAGMAEVVKYGVILDEDLFVALEDGLLESCLARVPEALGMVVERCLRLKAAVVSHDERERGPREILNFGHTLAHGIEQASGYRLLHGEAVAIGMVLEAAVAERQGVARPGMVEAIRSLCERADLPVALPPELEPEAVLEAARSDKKARAGALRCTLPSAIGTVPGQGRAVKVPESALREILGG